MDISVIVSTFNQPAWLEKTLTGYLHQDEDDFELLVADDGSGAETRRLVAGFAGACPFPLRHIWHEDRGYRRSDILNAAILASRGRYLVFSDGDCVPRRDFVRTHRELREPGRFLSGGSVRLSMGVSRRIDAGDVETGRFADPSWLREQGQALGRHRLRLLPRGRRARLLDRITTTRATWNLNNASTWREPLFAVNGMESEMQYGGADRALGSRLENLGLKGKQVRFRAVLLHLDHARPYKTGESIRRNKAIRRRIEREKEVRARNGLRELRRELEADPPETRFVELGPDRPGEAPPRWGPVPREVDRGTMTGEGDRPHGPDPETGEDR
jgi:glycosyltransferase involved in cell wall biosynthesis